jgi:hypothetical protein
MPNRRNVEDVTRLEASSGCMSQVDLHEKWRAPENLSIFCRTMFDVGHKMLILSFLSRAQSNDSGAFAPANRPKGGPANGT